MTIWSGNMKNIGALNVSSFRGVVGSEALLKYRELEVGKTIQTGLLWGLVFKVSRVDSILAKVESRQKLLRRAYLYGYDYQWLRNIGE